ncbi:helix-turn-helix domain-containing protein [Sulfitobacter sp.]|uniref:helix-turn-helix domain-containing protein n=1 Tax=Sulfitobacter sp. TaxID=1903071 RepID=UPI003FCCE13D
MIFPESGKMIEDYRSLAVFAAVADAGSLSAAGRRLKISKPVVSRRLSRLEDKLGATLFFRSTRSMSLTPEGHAALAPARRKARACRRIQGDDACVGKAVPSATVALAVCTIVSAGRCVPP